MPSPRKLLAQDHVSIPDWLMREPKLDQDTAQAFRSSRLAFYPGSGSDGQDLRLFGGSGAAHCFVHADYDRDDCGGNPLGYEVAVQQPLSRADLKNIFGFDLGRRFAPRDGLGAGQTLAGGLWTVFRRNHPGGDLHGATVLAMLFLRAEAVWTYWNLWTRRQAAPYAVVLQDHGFGGNWARFGGEGSPMHQRMVEAGALPEYLLVGENTIPWPEYQCVSGPDNDDGMHHFQRRLYQVPLRARE